MPYKTADGVSPVGDGVLLHGRHPGKTALMSVRYENRVVAKAKIPFGNLPDPSVTHSLEEVFLPVPVNVTDDCLEVCLPVLEPAEEFQNLMFPKGLVDVV